jgi:hypothetical protein
MVKDRVRFRFRVRVRVRVRCVCGGGDALGGERKRGGHLENMLKRVLKGEGGGSIKCPAGFFFFFNPRHR